MASKWTKCRKCQKELSMLAGACPGCGARRRPPWWAVVGLVVVILAGVGAIVGGKEKSAATPGPEPAPRPVAPAPAASPEPPVDVTAGKLYTEYKANEIGADAKYRNKVLRVTGLVARVGKNGLDEPMVVLQLAANPDGLRATF